MQLSDFEKKAVDRLARMFRERFGATEVILYGSAVRGDMDAESDIDLFVVLPETNWEIEKQIISLCFDEELTCGRVFSAACFGVDELYNSPLEASPFVQAVRKQGQSL